MPEVIQKLRRIKRLDREEVFAHLPTNRCGQANRRYMVEVPDDRF